MIYIYIYIYNIYIYIYIYIILNCSRRPGKPGDFRSLGRSKTLRGATWALENIAQARSEPLGRSKQVLPGAPEPLGVRNSCSQALRSHLGARKHCAGGLLGATWALENTAQVYALVHARKSIWKNSSRKPSRLQSHSASLHSVPLHFEDGYPRVHTSIPIYGYIWLYIFYNVIF